MYESSNLNHHENKMINLLKYIFPLLDMEKISGCVVTCLKLQVRTGSEQVRTDSEQVLQQFNVFLVGWRFIYLCKFCKRNELRISDRE